MSESRAWPATLPRLTDGVVTLRLPRPDDIDAITLACQDPDVVRWTVVPAPYLREHAEAYVESAQPSYATRERLPYVIADAATDALIGSAGFHHVNVVDGSAELGYWVAPSARQRGVARRAARLQLNAAPLFGLRHIEALIEAANFASIAVARGAGFVDSGEVRESLLRDTVRHHSVWVYEVGAK